MSYTQTFYSEDTSARLEQVVDVAQHIHDSVPLSHSPFRRPLWYRRLYKSYLIWVTRLLAKVLRVTPLISDELCTLRSCSAETRTLLLWLTKHGYIEYWNTTMLMPGMPHVALLNLQPTRIKTPNGNLYRIGGATGSGLGRTADEAAKPALGEFIERYACSTDWWKRRDLLTGSFSTMNQSGRAVDPKTLSYFSKEQQHDLTFPYTGYVEDMKLTWMNSREFTSGRSVRVPVSSIYIFYTKDNPNEPVFGEVTSNGAAAHSTYTQAVLSGIYELIERDSFLRAWYQRTLGRRIGTESLKELFPEFEDVLTLYEKRNIEFAMIDCTSDLGVPTASAVLINRNQGVQSVLVSAATDLDPRAVLEKLLLETIRFINVSTRDISEADDTTIRATAYGENCANGYDQRHILWSHPHMIKHMRWFVDQPEMHADEFISRYRTSTDVARSLTGTYEQLRAILKKHTISVYVADVTNDLARHAGLTVVHTISPDLVPIYFDERYQPLGLRRFTHDLNGRRVELNPVPHPFI